MKRLLLLRHAKAVPATEPLADIAPPARRARRARRTADRRAATATGAAPDSDLGEPGCARTANGAARCGTPSDYPRKDIALERGLYLAEPAGIVEIIAAQNAAIETLLVVGHNPGLTRARAPASADASTSTTCRRAPSSVSTTATPSLGRTSSALPAALCYYDFPKNSSAPVTASLMDRVGERAAEAGACACRACRPSAECKKRAPRAPRLPCGAARSTPGSRRSSRQLPAPGRGA